MNRITYNKVKRVNKIKELVAIKLNYSLNSKVMSDDFLDSMLDHAIIVKRELDKGSRNIIFDPKYIKVEKNMINSIYEETYKDVKRLMQDEFDDPSRHENPKLNKQERIDICIGVKQALEQAQKQCKLLELYKELANKIEVIDNAYGYGILGFDEIKHICEKIKGIENE